MGEDRELTLRPIGRVVKGLAGRRWSAGKERWEEGEVEIEIDPAWTEALDGIEGFSHIWVVWWLDRSSGSLDSLRVHPEGRAEMPLVGIFATRSPRRPNPIAITAVRLLERQGPRLRVEGLDAYEGTPVLDVKPYLRRGDLVAGAAAPEWLKRMWRIHDQEREP